MKGILAFVTIASGAIAASIGVARTDPSVEGWVGAYQVHTPLVVTGLALIVTGILIHRSGARAAAAATIKGGSLGTAAGALHQVVEQTAELTTRLDTFTGTAELHGLVDAIVAGPVTRFVENRQAITAAHGLGAYAAVLGPFAQGERYLNRAWSASTDGYLDEARTYIRKATPAFAEAEEELRQLESEAPATNFP